MSSWGEGFSSSDDSEVAASRRRSQRTLEERWHRESLLQQAGIPTFKAFAGKAFRLGDDVSGTSSGTGVVLEEAKKRFEAERFLLQPQSDAHDGP